MGKVVVMDHPLIAHKIGIIRKKETGTREFRDIISEIAMLLCYEATRELELEDVEIETPICKTMTQELKGKKLAVVPILRAGLGMVEGMLAMIPAAKVGHIGSTTASFPLIRGRDIFSWWIPCSRPAVLPLRQWICSRSTVAKSSASSALLPLLKV